MWKFRSLQHKFELLKYLKKDIKDISSIVIDKAIILISNLNEKCAYFEFKISKLKLNLT